MIFALDLSYSFSPSAYLSVATRGRAASTFDLGGLRQFRTRRPVRALSTIDEVLPTS